MGTAAGDARNGGEHFVATDTLAVSVAQTERDPRARRREGGEARFHKDPGATGVPGVRQDEHRPLDVEPAQHFGFGRAHRARR